jgi:O-antigen/teichoic acid export membrane protein
MAKHDDDYDHESYMSTTVVRVIIGAIVVGLLFLLFLWLLPVIGFILTVGLVVLLIILVVVGLVWLIRGIGNALADGRRRSKRSYKSED